MPERITAPEPLVHLLRPLSIDHQEVSDFVTEFLPASAVPLQSIHIAHVDELSRQESFNEAGRLHLERV